MRSTREGGYTLVELLVVMAIFAVVTTLISVSFNRIVASSGQLIKSTETEIGGLIGLELMRIDIGFAGFGLPFTLPAGMNYSEATKTHQVDDNPDTEALAFNDAPDKPPRAYVTRNNKGFNGSDYLVLKGTALGMTKAARAWSYLNYSSKGIVPASDLKIGNKVITVNSVVRGGTQFRDLISNGSTFWLKFDNQERIDKAFQPKNREDRYLVYGISDTDSVINFPFNRADYYVGPHSDTKKFSRNCAGGTGLLYRGMVTQTGDFSSFPVLDCVADMQVLFLLDTNGDEKITSYDDLGALTAEQIREQVKEVRVHILAQQGKKDPSYAFPDQKIDVGDRRWNRNELLTTFGPDWMHYRWKVYNIVVQPKNLD